MTDEEYVKSLIDKYGVKFGNDEIGIRALNAYVKLIIDVSKNSRTPLDVSFDKVHKEVFGYPNKTADFKECAKRFGVNLGGKASINTEKHHDNLKPFGAGRHGRSKTIWAKT